MTEHTEYAILIANIDVIDQGLGLLQVLTDEQYVFIPAPYVSSSIAQHFRHVVDMFKAVNEGINGRLVDYDVRRRGDKIETCRVAAQLEMREILSWMTALCRAQQNGAGQAFAETLKIRTEISTKAAQSISIASSVARELVFASSHAVHHYALISVIAKLQGVELERELGLAPATATFLRSEALADGGRLKCAP